MLLFPFLAYSVTGTFIPLESNYSSDTTIDENYTVVGGDANPANFTGILFQKSKILNIDSNATVTVNVDVNGNYTGYSGAIFRGQNGSTYTINGGNIIFNINKVQKVGGGLEG